MHNLGNFVINLATRDDFSSYRLGVSRFCWLSFSIGSWFVYGRCFNKICSNRPLNNKMILIESSIFTSLFKHETTFLMLNFGLRIWILLTSRPSLVVQKLSCSGSISRFISFALCIVCNATGSFCTTRRYDY